MTKESTIAQGRLLYFSTPSLAMAGEYDTYCPPICRVVERSTYKIRKKSPLFLTVSSTFILFLAVFVFSFRPINTAIITPTSNIEISPLAQPAVKLEEKITNLTLAQPPAITSAVSQELEQITLVQEIISSLKIKKVDSRKLAIAIVHASNKEGLDPLLVTSLIKAESTFNPIARSHKGAQGLMQIMPETGKYITSRYGLKWHGTEGLYEPHYNLTLGIVYLKELKGKFRTLEHALIAYNWGPTNLHLAFKGEKKIPRSSIVYARSIIHRHSQWKDRFLTRTASSSSISPLA